MKKFAFGLFLSALFYFPFSEQQNTIAANGYEMQTERCSDGSTQLRCRPKDNKICSISGQTDCGGGGGGPIQ
jgi:hypothetical protein